MICHTVILEEEKKHTKTVSQTLLGIFSRITHAEWEKRMRAISLSEHELHIKCMLKTRRTGRQANKRRRKKCWAYFKTITLRVVLWLIYILHVCNASLS